MDLTGEYLITAPREQVWAALNDPDILAKVIPGCETLTRTGDNGFEAIATQTIGPVKARFKGKVALEDLNPPESYTLKGEGSGGPAGFAKGEARIRLEPVGDQTKLVYTVKASIGGQLARIGQRLVDQAAKKIADEFFASFGALVSAPALAAGQVAPVSAAPAPPKPKSNTRFYVLLAILVGIIALIAILA